MSEQEGDDGGKKAVQTRLDYEDYIEFNVAASREDLSKSELLRQLVNDFLDQEGGQQEGNGIQLTAEESRA